MKRLLRWLLFGLLLGGLTVLILGDEALEFGSRRAMSAAVSALARMGVKITYPDIGEAKLAFPATARWRKVTGSVAIGPESPLGREVGLDVAADFLELRPTSPLLNRFRVVIRDAEARSVYLLQSNTGPRISDVSLRIERLEAPLRVAAIDPMPGLRTGLHALRGLLREGVTPQPFELEGIFRFRIDGAEAQLRCRSDERLGGFGLVAEQADILALVGHFGRILTPAEIEMVSRYPLQAAEMLRIQNYATNTALEAAARDPQVPEDAYRHLLWSYLLTKRFGPALAQIITDAHEVGSLTNTEADHRMDYHNNAVGRRYAEQGRTESEILSLARRDPDVVREPI